MARPTGLLGLALCVACGSGGGSGRPSGEGGAAGGGGQGGGTLHVLETFPSDQATDVAPNAVLRAEFDAALDESSVTSSSFLVRSEGGLEVAGAISVSGDIAELTPSGSLGLLSSYTATLTTAVASVTRATLDEAVTWGFRVRDGQWGEPVLIETNNAGNAAFPEAAAGPNGEVVAVWYQSDGDRNNIWANRFTPGVGWGVAELIETDDAGSALDPDVAVGPDGEAIAVWHQSDGDRNNIWANRFTPGVGWDTPELIESNDAGGAFSAQVGADSNGNAIAVWAQSDGTRLNVFANRFTPSEGWGTPELIEADDGGTGAPQLAVDPSGNAIAVWAQESVDFDAWANRFTPDEGWGTPELIEVDVGNVQNPDVAVDANGNAIAVWAQSDGTRPNVFANRFTPSEGWGTAELIEANDPSAFMQQVAVGSSGDAIAVWVDSSPTFRVWANRFTPDEGWGSAVFIENRPGLVDFPQVVVDAKGNAVAVWKQIDPVRASIWANRLTPSSGWGTAELIDTADAGDASGGAAVAVDPNGNAVAVWAQSDSSRFNLWANRFD
ncbi:MAG: Ig-like domain-containing protein [Myxococcales bacterium]|nr:Ig-like domain-containing protein [Myxococcales bacterium]